MLNRSKMPSVAQSNSQAKSSGAVKNISAGVGEKREHGERKSFDRASIIQRSKNTRQCTSCVGYDVMSDLKKNKASVGFDCLHPPTYLLKMHMHDR